ncbi:NAC domain-containing protein 22-like [Zingiber officinale]|uniref:NAC domain-containing protein n=1 Tax=Zingiber officinale TaxID=94328 RepID=A0A8J5KUR5_ZINOF|nr:NAC domain-containing protein 22-like [Zingiber officinale]KAG6491538.1 hypothetical protein ZIOFF_046470 [Zingiber officinale]
MDLPGFRFHPTEEELLDFYLRSRVEGKKLQLEIITTVNLYRYDPWQLPGLAKIGETEWYFYVPRDRNGNRPSRMTERGFWKATGGDRPVRSAADPRRLIGLKKTLVYYEGRAPRGAKTEWVMKEYRLPEHVAAATKEEIVLCKIHRKSASVKELEQRAAEAESAASGDATFTDPVAVDLAPTMPASSIRRPAILPELEVPKQSGMEWLQEPLLTQVRSPWLMDFWSPSIASILNC